MKKILSMLLILVLTLALVACGGNTQTSQPADTSEPADAGETVETGDIEDTKVDVSRVRVVIGSTSTGGDTYENADFITRYLEDEMGTNVRVDPVGAARAFVELQNARNDGSTIMFFHDMAYLGVEFGSFDQRHALENWTIGPVVSTNPGNAFLANHDAPYDTLAEAAEWLVANPSETISIAIEAGGVSELSFHAIYSWVREEYGTEVSDRVRAFITGSQSDKDQALWDGNADIIHGSMGANGQYTEDGVDERIKMKFLGLTASERMVEFPDVPTFKEQGITFEGEAFIFDKEFFFLLPNDVDPVFAAKLDKAVENIVLNQPSYEQTLNGRTYVLNHKPASEAKDYLLQKRDSIQRMIQQAPDLDDITSN